MHNLGRALDNLDFFWNRSFGRKQSLLNQMRKVNNYFHFFTSKQGNRIVFNSIPKSGTHLGMSLLDQMNGIVNSGYFFSDIHHGKYRQSLCDNRAKIERISKRFYFGCHMPHSDTDSKLLQLENMKMILMVRHPKDILLSQYHHIMDRPTNRAHIRFLQLSSRYDRLKVLLEGVEIGAGIPPIEPFRKLFDSYIAWADYNDVLVLKFEDLIGVKGGGEKSRQVQSIKDVSNFINSESLTESEANKLANKVFDSNSNTFRKGIINNWHRNLTTQEIDLIHTELDGVGKKIGY